MKPSTQKTDAAVWKLWKAGVAPKDIKAQLNLTMQQVYKGLKRERVRRGLVLPRRKRAKTGEPKRRARRLHSKR